MEQTPVYRFGASPPCQQPAQSLGNDSSDDRNLSTVATAASQHNQATLPIILFPLGLFTIGTSIGAIAWLWVHGPALVPRQDTRITSIIISVGVRLSAFFINAALLRSAWAAYLPRVLAGDRIPNQALVGISRNFMSLGQLENYRSLPGSFKYHIILAVVTSLAMTGSSASFRIVSLGLPGRSLALVPDVASLCNGSTINVNGSGYFCNGDLNSNTTGGSWTYLQNVNTGGQKTVQRFGEFGDVVLGANVTLATLPAGWTLGQGNDLPWMAMWVTCHNLSISADFLGTNLSAITNIFVNGNFVDSLDISNMPEWGSIVHQYQQVNESSPASSLCPWIVVALGRDLGDGTANFGGLAPDAVTYLGNSYLDLHGYSTPKLQGILGAAAWCQFNGSTGGTWPEELWPPLNHTSNVVIGTVIDDRPTMGTAMLNYGPSWQYNLVSENSLPGGSVSYIANNTGTGVSFPALFSSYIRNQWTLMAYSITPQSGQHIYLPFAGLGPNKLYISITSVSLLPASALVIGLLITLRAWICTIRKRHWVNRVEFESWWFIKALRPDMYRVGNSNATTKDFNKALDGFSTSYRDINPHGDVGQLALCSEWSDGNTSKISLSAKPRRVYG
jgi:hypothetical protein